MPDNYCGCLRMELLSLWRWCKQGRNHPVGWGRYATDSQHRCSEWRTRAFEVFRLFQQLPFIAGGSFACAWKLKRLWGWSLDLLGVRGQTIERHVPPRWHNSQAIGVCSCVTGMNPSLLPAFLKWHPHIKNWITLTHIFNPLDQVSPNPVLEGPKTARFSVQPEGAHDQESFVYLGGQKSRLGFRPSRIGFGKPRFKA